MASSNQFNIDVATVLNTDGVEKQIKDLNLKLKKSSTVNIKINGNEAIKQIKTLTDEFGNLYKTSQIWKKDGTLVKDSFDKIDASVTTLITETHKLARTNGSIETWTKTIDSAGNTIRTRTKESIDDFGNLVTEVQKFEIVTEQTASGIVEHFQPVGDAIRNVSQIIKEVKTTSDQSYESIERNGQAYQALVTTITEVKSNGESLTTTIREYTDAEGFAVVETQKFNQANQQITPTTIEKTRAIQQSTQALNNNVKQQRQNINISQQLSNANKTLGQSFSDIVVKVSKFYLASLPIRMVQTAINETISTVKDFDDALVEFRKVSDLAGDGLQDYINKLAEMGKLTGSTVQAMVEASTEFKKSGFTDEESAQLASIAEMYRNIADEEITAGDSASFIISQMKAFNITADESMHIIDAINEVSNNYAVSSADLATNIGKVSSTLAITGTEYEEQLGMLTAITEVTRNASTASRGLKMISSRLTQTLDESSGTGKKLIAIYDKLGISLLDDEGQLRSTYDILADLSTKWETLSKNEQEYIALTSAGANQQQNFTALMENFSTAIRATETAYASSGSAMAENEKVMDTIEKKLQILKSEFQTLVIGEGGLQDFAKNIIDLGTKLLKFANSDLGKTIIKFIELESVMLLLNRAFQSLNIVKLIQDLMMSAQMAGLATTTTGAFSIAIKQLTKDFIANAVAWATTPMGMATIVIAGVVALCYAMQQYNNQIANNTQKLKESSEAYKQTQDLLDSYEESLKNIKKQIEDINKEKLEITDQQQLTKLQQQTTELQNQEDSLQRQIELLKIKAELENTKNIENAREVLSSTKINQVYPTSVGKTFLNAMINPYSIEGRATGWSDTVTLSEELDQAKTKYIGLQLEISELRDQEKETGQDFSAEIADKVDELEDLKQIIVSDIETVSTALTELEKSTDETDKKTVETTQGLIDSIFSLIDPLYSAKEATQDYIDATDDIDDVEEDISEEEQAILDLAEAHNVSADDLKKWAKAVGMSERALVDYADSIGIGVEKAYEFQSAIQEWNDGVDAMQEAFNTLGSAVEEYNENGYYSLDTLQSLLELSPEYLSLLQDENGQLSLNEEAMVNMVNARIEERKQMALEMAMERLDALEREDNSASTETQTGKIDTNTEALGDESDALMINTAQQYANKIARSDSTKKADAEKIIADLKKQLDVLNDLGNSFQAYGGSASSAGKKASGGSKSATDALKDQKKALDDLKSQYDKVITFITGRIDKVIKRIEKEKETAINSIEAQIDAKERQKDNALNNIEDQISALEDQQKVREEYWDAQIDKLKESNDALKDQLELQEKLDALEKARNTKVKVYKEGQGFVYDVDQTAVAEAQKALDEYLSEKAYEDELDRLEKLKDAEVKNYEDRIDALNKYKDSVERSYEEQIANLEASRDALEDNYDAQIEYYNNYKDQFEEMVNAYEDKQTELLASQLTGINFENDNWLTRLDNLAHFVNEYNKLQAKIGDGSTENSASVNTSSGGSGTSKTSNNTSQGRTVLNVLNERESAARIRHHAVVVNKHANGTSSISDDELAIVGENPNKELVIGSKANNGTLMSLGKGDGVVNAKSTNTLAGLLNQLGNFGASNFGGGNGILNDSHNESFVVNGVTIQGANITDPQSFVNGLLNMKAEALQRAYRHS